MKKYERLNNSPIEERTTKDHSNRHKTVKLPTQRLSLIFTILLLVFIANYFVDFLHDSWGDAEEAKNGLLAQGFVDGLIAPISYYQYQPWAHGPLVYGFLLAPLYWLSDSYMFWIKVIGGIFAILAFVFWSRISFRWGISVFVLFTVWWIFPPPFFGQQLHTVWANHMEALFPAGVLFWSLAKNKHYPPHADLIAVFAIFAGFFSFFTAHVVLFSITALLVTLIRHKLAWKKIISISFLAFIIGFAPRLFLLFLMKQDDIGTSEFCGPLYLLQNLFVSYPPQNSTTLVTQAYDLFFITLPRFAGYQGIVSALFFVIFFAAWGFSIVKFVLRRADENPQTRHLELALTIYCGLLFISLLVGPFRIMEPLNPYWHRYLTPVFPIMMLLIVIKSNELSKWLGVVLVGFFVMAAAYDSLGTNRMLSTWDGINSGGLKKRILTARGDDYKFFIEDKLPIYWKNELMASKAFNSESNMKKVCNTVRKLPPYWQASGWENLGFRMVMINSFSQFSSQCEWTEKEKSNVIFGIAHREWKNYFYKDPATIIKKTMARFENIHLDDPIIKKAIVEGIGYGVAELGENMRRRPGMSNDSIAPLIKSDSGFDSLLSVLDAQTMDLFCYGYGRGYSKGKHQCYGSKLEKELSVSKDDPYSDVCGEKFIHGQIDEFMVSAMSLCNVFMASELREEHYAFARQTLIQQGAIASEDNDGDWLLSY